MISIDLSKNSTKIGHARDERSAMSFIPVNTIMRRSSRNDFSLRACEDPADDEERLYERQALILDDNSDICYDEINSGQVVMRHRPQSEKDKQRAGSNGYELKNINNRTYKDSNSENNAVEFTYYDIQPGDSLQNICLRYTCSINQVKRLNGLMTDQDFYGLRRLKLPLGKLGLLEDLLKQQQNGSQDLLILNDMNANQSRPRLMNSPGSALSIANGQTGSRFKPLLSPGYSSDRINELDRAVKTGNYQPREQSDPINGQASLQNNSHSFSSLRGLADDDTNIDINNQDSFHLMTGNSVKLPQQSFIKSEILPDSSQVTIDSLLTVEQPVVANVFEDLDYHVERAKAAAGSYEQRAAELVSVIESSNGGVGPTGYEGPRPSKIPELFFSGENFGLNIKRVIMLIFFVCLVIPIVYISQANVIK